jgi:hypothetical protein
LEDFLNGFDGLKGNNDGIVTKQEFWDYYTDLSMSLPSDEYFVKMMESVWCIVEDDSSQVNKQQIEYLTKTLRQCLLKLSKSS